MHQRHTHGSPERKLWMSLDAELTWAMQVKMSNVDAVLRDAVEAFVVQLKGIFQQLALEKIQSALSDDVAPVRRQRGASNGPRTPKSARRKGAKRSPEELEALTKSLLAYVRKNAGQRIEQIAEGMGTSTKELALPAKKLIAGKQLATKGQKRATTYYVK